VPPGTGGPPPSITPPGGFDAFPAFCLDLRRFLDTSVEMFSLSTTTEVSTRLESLSLSLSSMESSGGAQFASDARALRIGLDGVVSRLSPGSAVQDTYRTIADASVGLAPAADRLVSQGLSQCGGSDNPVLSTQEGVTALLGAR